MAEQHSNPQQEIDELTRTIDEYRSRIDEIVRKERDKFRQQVDAESNHIVDRAWQKAETIIAESQLKAVEIRESMERRAGEEASLILEEAKRQAQQVVAGAEEQIKKEAKNRVKGEVEKIISKARDESRDVIAQARQAAQTEASGIVAKAQGEADNILKGIRENCQTEMQEQSKQILGEVTAKAEKVIDDVMSSSAGVSKLISEIMQRAEAIMAKFKQEMQVEFTASTMLIAEGRQKLENAMAGAVSQFETAATIADIHEELNRNAVLSVQLKGEITGGRDGGGSLFKGRMELKTVSSYHYPQIRKLRNFLVQVPNIKFVEEYASEKGATLLFDVKEPLPLFDILGKMPSVADAVAEGDNVRLVLKN